MANVNPAKILPFALTLVAGLVAGYGSGRLSIGSPVNPQGSYQEGYDAAKKKLAESGLIPPALTELRSLTGTIKSVGSGSLVIEAPLRSPNPLEELNAPAERTVTLGTDVKIVKSERKDPVVFEKELQEFQKKNGQTPGASAPPSPFLEKTLSLQDLKVGDVVTVVAGENILMAASFTAGTVSLGDLPAEAFPSLPRSNPPPPPTQEYVDDGPHTTEPQKPTDHQD